jgi:hypothetical protein
MSSYLYLLVDKVQQTDITEDRALTLESRVRCSFLHWPLTSSEKIWESGGSMAHLQSENRHTIRKSTAWSQFYLQAFLQLPAVLSAVSRTFLHLYKSSPSVAGFGYYLVGMDMKRGPCFLELAILNDLIHSERSLNKQEIFQICQSALPVNLAQGGCAT